MGQVLHRCARTTQAVRRAIQNSQESIMALATRYGINPKTVVKWKKRNTADDLPMGPKDCTPTAVYRGHPFDRVCRQYDIEHRLTKLNYPWTNGQVERMNRTLKDVMVHRYFYQTHAGLQEHLDAFINAYNFAKCLKTLRGLTPYEYIVKTWTEEPERFVTEPYQLTAGLYG